MIFGISSFGLIWAIIKLFTSDFQPVTKIGTGIILATLLNLLVFAGRLGLNQNATENIMLAAATGIVFIAVIIHKAQPKSTSGTISFNCPFCQDNITYDRHLQGAGEACTSCGEIVTVTTDASVHAREREEYLALIKQAAEADPVPFDAETAEAVKAGNYHDPFLHGRM